MKKIILSFFIGLLTTNLSAQVSYSNIDSKLKVVKTHDTTQLTCSTPEHTMSFRLIRSVTMREEQNFVTIDSQLIQVAPLKIEGSQKNPAALSIDEQKKLLTGYSNYELDYLRSQNVEVVDPKNQWVITKSKGWLIWYYAVGKIPVQAAKQVKFQLFASTIVGDNVLTINAPCFSDTNFPKAALIVNEMMESLTISKK